MRVPIQKEYLGVRRMHVFDWPLIWARTPNGLKELLLS